MLEMLVTIDRLYLVVELQYVDAQILQAAMPR
jgi:hypothetical protein